MVVMILSCGQNTKNMKKSLDGVFEEGTSKQKRNDSEGFVEVNKRRCYHKSVNNHILTCNSTAFDRFRKCSSLNRKIFEHIKVYHRRGNDTCRNRMLEPKKG